MDLFLDCLITFTACFAISIHFNVKGKLIFFAALGGALSYYTYVISSPTNSVIIQNFFASIVASIYSESLARILKVPAPTFLIISIIPLVPGSNLYRTMELCISSKLSKFASSAVETLGIAGAIALGILLVSSMFRFAYVIQKLNLHKKTNSEGNV